MSEPIYRFRRGFSGDARAAYDELERIRSEHGSLRSDTILEAATPEDAVLHDLFPWDDAVAAHQHRLEIARALPRAIEVIRDNRPPESVYVHHSPETRGPGEYTPLSIIASEPDVFLSALTEARADLASAQRRVNELLTIAKSTGAKKGEVARIMLAVQALQTANEAIHALN